MEVMLLDLVGGGPTIAEQDIHGFGEITLARVVFAEKHHGSLSWKLKYLKFITDRAVVTNTNPCKARGHLRELRSLTTRHYCWLLTAY